MFLLKPVKETMSNNNSYEGLGAFRCSLACFFIIILQDIETLVK